MMEESPEVIALRQKYEEYEQKRLARTPSENLQREGLSKEQADLLVEKVKTFPSDMHEVEVAEVLNSPDPTLPEEYVAIPNSNILATFAESEDFCLAKLVMASQQTDTMKALLATSLLELVKANRLPSKQMLDRAHEQELVSTNTISKLYSTTNKSWASVYLGKAAEGRHVALARGAK